MHAEESGAFTGEVSGPMLVDASCRLLHTEEARGAGWSGGVCLPSYDGQGLTAMTVLVS